MKNYKKILIAFFILLTFKNSGFADYLWDINVGIDEFYNNNLEFAKDYFISYLNNNPNDKDGYWWLANTQKQLKDKKYLVNFKKSYELLSKEKNLEKISFNIKNSANIEDYFDMATMYFDSGNLKEADFYADMMLKINPKSSSAYYIKAGIANVNGDNSKAKDYMESAIIYNSELIKTNLAQSLNITEIPKANAREMQLFSFENYFEGNLDEAIEYQTKANAINPQDAEIASVLANLYFKKRQYEPISKIIDTALKTNENNISLLLDKAYLYKIEKNKTAQINTLLKAYKINPNNQNVLLELGNYYLENKDYENAKKYFETLSVVNDFLYEGIFGLANSLLNLGQIEQAGVEIRKLNKLNPNASEISYLLSKICSLEGDYAQALDYIEEALREDENPNYYLEEAKLYYILKEYKISLQSLDDASIMPYSANNQEEIKEYYIKNYIKLKQGDEAKKYLTQLSNDNKNRIIYKYDLYNLYKLTGQDDKAYELYTEIRRFKPSSVQDFIDLSDAFYEMKGLDSAIKILDIGHRKYPNDKELYFQKIKLYSFANDKEKRFETLKKLKENSSD